MSLLVGLFTPPSLEVRLPLRKWGIILVPAFILARRRVHVSSVIFLKLLNLLNLLGGRRNVKKMVKREKRNMAKS
jgi:hypothetical protein